MTNDLIDLYLNEDHEDDDTLPPTFVSIGFPGRRINFMADPNDGSVTINYDHPEDIAFDFTNFGVLSDLLVAAATPPETGF